MDAYGFLRDFIDVDAFLSFIRRLARICRFMSTSFIILIRRSLFSVAFYRFGMAEAFDRDAVGDACLTARAFARIFRAYASGRTAFERD